MKLRSGNYASLTERDILIHGNKIRPISLSPSIRPGLDWMLPSTKRFVRASNDCAILNPLNEYRNLLGLLEIRDNFFSRISFRHQIGPGSIAKCRPGVINTCVSFGTLAWRNKGACKESSLETWDIKIGATSKLPHRCCSSARLVLVQT